jgi:transcriptional regulator with XRE-family HTH domain
VQRQAFWVEPRQPQGHSRVALLPWVPYTRKVLIFKGTRVKPAGAPTTVGEHVLKKRLDDGLTRKELARRLGVDEFTVMNWELGRTKTIPARAIPGVIAYLGYNPEPKPEHVGAQLRWKRRSLGWSTQDAARMNSVDPSTWEAWEKLDAWPCYPRYCKFLQEFVAAPSEELVRQIRQVAPASPRRGHRLPSSS